jgi:hypothetical protein
MDESVEWYLETEIQKTVIRLENILFTIIRNEEELISSYQISEGNINEIKNRIINALDILTNPLSDCE